MDDYIYDRVVNHIDIVAHNFLIRYVNKYNLEERVSYEMIDIIAHEANEYTSPQMLVDNLYSMLDD